MNIVAFKWVVIPQHLLLILGIGSSLLSGKVPTEWNCILMGRKW